MVFSAFLISIESLPRISMTSEKNSSSSSGMDCIEKVDKLRMRENWPLLWVLMMNEFNVGSTL